MSLVNFQSALAYVIRSFDANNTKSLDELTRIYELSPDESSTLENLIHQQRLKAYSEELFLARWSIIREALEFLSPFVDLKAMSELWEQDFEKKSATVVYEDLVLKFTEYLVHDPVGAQFISTGTPAFMPSLIKYVHAVFTFRHNVLPHHTLLPHSLLSDRYFEVIKFNYDVRELFAELVEREENEDSLPDPARRDLTLLFMATDEVTVFRSFEIDQELTDFLEAQLKGDTHKKKPACYEDLVDVGLCKSGSIKRACCAHHH